MSREKSAVLDWNHVTDHHATILEAYFSHYQTLVLTTIGSGEILRWSALRRADSNDGAAI
jgi:hypothetical protein